MYKTIPFTQTEILYETWFFFQQTHFHLFIVYSENYLKQEHLYTKKPQNIAFNMNTLV